MCAERIAAAESFNQEHFHVPARYLGLPNFKVLAPRDGYLLHGPSGSRKTGAAFGALQAWAEADPRLRIAAYRWTDVLMLLKRGYGPSAGAEVADNRGDRMVDALRAADVTLIDDLGAEQMTETNRAWRQGTLFTILDVRYEEFTGPPVRPTILVSDLPLPELETYLGERLARRVFEICQRVEMERVV